MERKTLALLRRENGLTQRELASLLEVSPGLVGLWEAGKRTPTLKKAIEISDLFGFPVEKIVFSKHEVPKS